jgi:3'-phosphoadenosine 5'-phosphosulfate sulfotransferase (PAPS reductase)/FAD synthetase
MSRRVPLPMAAEVPIHDRPAKPDFRALRPTSVTVSFSGGKDSFLALQEAIRIFGQELVLAHYQEIEEDWPGTKEYGAAICEQLGIPFYSARGIYHGYRCLDCGHTYLFVNPEKASCRAPQGCGSRKKEEIALIDSVHDLIRWRKMFPSDPIRFCTKYMKGAVWDAWARHNGELLGDRPVLVLGERWAESRRRATLPWVQPRHGFSKVTEAHLILDRSRRDAFRAHREAGIAPHYCYALKWANWLHIQHYKWCEMGIEPPCSYPGQWDGLQALAALPDDVVQAMISMLMYEVDQEGGPRNACRDCFYDQGDWVLATYQIPSGKVVLDDADCIEQETGFTRTQGVWLRDRLKPFTVPGKQLCASS